MTITVEAVFQDGVLKPKGPVVLAEGAEVRLTITPLDDRDDPLADVIGICDQGPDLSLAERHDEILYGLRPGSEAGH
jgi:predicted DNA-binding antitoxin AbrB/MazE fold protein